MKILVTGGAGFIGSNLCEKLIELGHIVHSVDNYSTGTIDNHVAGVVYHKMNTEDILLSSDDIFNEFVPDIVYHLGEYSRVEQSFNEPVKVWQYNMSGTISVLEYIRQTGAKLIYAGSSTKFADNGANQSPYAFSKSSNTQLVKNYSEWYGIDYAITYFYNAYGKREISSGQYATLIAKFTEKMKLGEELTVTLPGIQMRNFTHIDDIIDGLILVGFNGYGDEFGIGSDESYSVNDIAHMFGGKIKYTPEKKGNRISANVISDKTKELGWKCKRNIKDYIKELLK